MFLIDLVLNNTKIYFLLTIAAILPFAVVFETSYTQNDTIQNSAESRESNINLSSSLNTDLTIANNSSDAISIKNYFKDFRMNNDTDQWIIQSGNWNETSEGLHGNSTDRFVNNIILSNITPIGDDFVITALFKINDVNENMTNPASIVYSFVDKRNYDQAGIHVSNNDIYLKISRAVNNTFEYMPAYPGIKTDLTWDSGKIFNMTLISQGNAKYILLNGTMYSFDSQNANEGLNGLSYGPMKSIDFLTYKYQGLNSSIIDDILKNHLPNTANADSQTIMLGEKTLPEDSYIPVYDAAPFQIKSGHLTAKFPCDESGTPEVDVLVGQVPNLEAIELEFVGPSIPSEELCIYRTDIKSDETNHIIDMVIQNNSTDDIEFPETSGLIISIGEISKIS
jgi:hypothetical protein